MSALEPNETEDLGYYLKAFGIDLSIIESVTLNPNETKFDNKFTIHFRDGSDSKSISEFFQKILDKKYKAIPEGDLLVDDDDLSKEISKEISKIKEKDPTAKIDDATITEIRTKIRKAIPSTMRERLKKIVRPLLSEYIKVERENHTKHVSAGHLANDPKILLEKLHALKKLKTQIEQSLSEREVIFYSQEARFNQQGGLMAACMRDFVLIHVKNGSKIFSPEDIASMQAARRRLLIIYPTLHLDTDVSNEFGKNKLGKLGSFAKYIISKDEPLKGIIEKIKSQDNEGLPFLFEIADKLLEKNNALKQLYATLASRALSLNDVKQLLDLSTSLKKIKIDNSKIVQAAFQSTVNNTKEVALKQIKEMFTYFSDPKNAAHIDKNKLRQAFYASISERTDLTLDDLKSLFAFVKSTKDQPVKLTRKGMMDVYYNVLASRTNISFEEVKELYNFGYETKKSAFQKSNIRKFDTSKLTASILQSLKNSNNLNEMTDILLFMKDKDKKINIIPVIDSFKPVKTINNFHNASIDLRDALSQFRNFDPDLEYRLKFFTELSDKLDIYNNLKNAYQALAKLRDISPIINNQLKIVQGYIGDLNYQIGRHLSTLGFQSTDPSADLKQEIARLQAEKERENAVLESTSVEQAPDNLLRRLSNATQTLDEMKKKKEKEDHPAIDETSKRSPSLILPSGSASVKPKIPEIPESTEKRSRPKPNTH